MSRILDVRNSDLVCVLKVLTIVAITNVGDIPYELIRPILLKLENPEQLVVIFLPRGSVHLVTILVEGTLRYGESS